MLQVLLRALETTHMHVVGSSGYGKSKFLESLLHEAHFADYGFCVIDWHGTLHRDLVNWFAYLQPNRPVYLLDLAESEYVTAYNPFVGGTGDVSALVSSRIAATVKPWGADNTDDTPRLSRMLRCLYTFAAETGHTLPVVEHLVRPENLNLRKHAAAVSRDNFIRGQWRSLAEMTPDKFRAIGESTQNRLDRFLAPLTVRRIIGRQSGNLDIGRILDEGAILLVNLRSRNAETESGKVLAALLLADFMNAALSRTTKPTRPFLLCLDEFQEYVTHDVAAMLDQTRKAGLHLVLCHQRLGQLSRDVELDDAVANEAQIKVVFGGLRYENAAQLAEDLFIPEVNKRQIKETYYHTVTKHRLERVFSHATTTSQSRGKGTSASLAHFADSENAWQGTGDSEMKAKSRSETLGESMMLIPYYEFEKTHDAEWGRDEKVSRAAERLMALGQRQCYIKLIDGEPLRYLVNDMPPTFTPERTVREYVMQLLLRQGCLPVAEHDAAMAAEVEEFFAAVTPKRKPKPQPTSPHDPPRI
jgi:hypothetical protein